MTKQKPFYVRSITGPTGRLLAMSIVHFRRVRVNDNMLASLDTAGDNRLLLNSTRHEGINSSAPVFHVLPDLTGHPIVQHDSLGLQMQDRVY
jgi:hypothetical protein